MKTLRVRKWLNSFKGPVIVIDHNLLDRVGLKSVKRIIELNNSKKTVIAKELPEQINNQICNTISEICRKNKKFILLDEAHLLFSEETGDSKKLRKHLYEFRKPAGYKSTVNEQSLKEKE